MSERPITYQPRYALPTVQRTYDPLFRWLLIVADALAFLYFFVLPSHQLQIEPILNWFLQGIRAGLH